MKHKTIETFRAVATFGAKKGYSEEMIPISDFKKAVTSAQKEINEKLDIKLSAKISPCSIIFSGQDEPSYDLSFIQYPKFPYPVTDLKNAILQLCENLMEKLHQNRVVIVYDDETIMLEQNEDQLDPGINFPS
ncbi:replication initiation protein [Salegentibacter maritimus]|uniref:hypothetical protein n=1 Tax=Salegentibacter maritimus TaxID=2794347 RepID=UPI0018E419E3|nr:hypothetical protein [Salegentibacter maritimus]MBI6115984.1 hypothetical protein [Salegentibacter maritimus]